MTSLLRRFFDSNDKEIKRLRSVVTEINALEEKTKKLKDTDFPKKTQDFKKRIQEGESLQSVLPEAFALVREAARRRLGLRHYDVQLMAAMALSEGKIAEQKTGEGKTMSAVPALYLNSLTGRSVHLVTVNDYLARRDCGWMGPIFDLLGVTVSSIISEQSFIYDHNFTKEGEVDERIAHLRSITRQEAYQADVLYGINSEFGFDYLRDNMVRNSEQIVQRDFYFAIVDEVDSVLIDEARTPHIISAPDDAPSAKYYEYAKLVEKLSADTDYQIDEKLRTVHLTDHGIGKIEKLFGLSNIYEQDFDTVYHIEASLKARTLFHKEKDYIVKDGQVVLVDEFTGRLMEGRRLSEGLHQAIEAKEGVPIQRESKTLATVSLQNYFRMYEKLSGMTGTAVTEAEEFNKIYKLDVVVIPTHNTVIREDLSDVVYKTTRAKITAVVKEIEEAHKKGQPVLIGTTSIDKNEIISELLKRRGIKHEVLNAKNHLREAQIIAQAGKKGAVTVATNMAGRGVDIILGGARQAAASGNKQWEKEHKEVLELGGLYVIGTERHESRRIDNQLRGRAGRQGDPGKSQFFVALDDEIMRLFGGDRIANLMTRFNMPEDVPLTHGLVSKAIENAQVKVEGFNFDIRKHLVEYDDVLNKQREIVYSLRRKVVDAEKNNESLEDDILERTQRAISSLVVASNETASFEEVENVNEKIIHEYVTIVPFDAHSQTHLIEQIQRLGSIEQKEEFLLAIAKDVYQKRKGAMGEDVMKKVERFVMLSVLDNLWMDHLDAIDNLRSGIGLRGYAQKDPLVEYKNEAYTMFEQLMWNLDDQIVHRIYKIQVHDAPVPEATVDLSRITTNTPESEISDDAKTKKAKVAQKAPQSTEGSGKKIGRNDPCWCGSGKKYKRCHYPN
ncbi:MAG: preprotein translocase subunit SecA [Candidatus Levybacteria bacterium]|nr:preprotein translocase subunit SecA [Candidatus Levybacteria bacterium]